MTSSSFRMLWHSLIDGPVHHRGSQFPIVRGGITSSASLLACVAILVYYLLPWWIRLRSSVDVRPFMLIWSAVLFAINGAGFMIALALTNWGRETLTCERDFEDLKDLITAYLGYAYFVIKFLDFGRILFAVVRDKKSQASLMNFLQISLLVLLIQSGIYFHPGGVGYFIGVVDTFTGTFVNAYYILTTAKVFHKVDLWKKRLVRLQALGYTALLMHALFFLMDPRCKNPKLFLCTQMLFAASSLLFSAYKYPNFLLSSSKLTLKTL